MQTDSQTEFLNDPLPTLLPLIRVTASLNRPLAMGHLVTRVGTGTSGLGASEESVQSGFIMYSKT